MFKVEKTITTERCCPNGHSPLPNLWPENDHSVKFCPICGTSIEEEQTVYDAALCANCNNPVHPSWNSCPYCGQSRE